MDETIASAASEPPASVPAQKRRRAYHGKLLEARAAGKSINEAAQSAGVSRRTAQRWERENGAELHQAHEQLVQVALRELRLGTVTAARRLVEEVQKEGNGQNAISAARVLFQAHRDLTEQTLLEERLCNLERQLGAQAPAPGGAPPRFRTILGGAGATP